MKSRLRALDASVLLVGDDAAADALFVRLSSEGLELERCPVQQVAAMAQAVAPDLVVVLADVTAQQSRSALDQLTAGRTTARVPVLLLHDPRGGGSPTYPFGDHLARMSLLGDADRCARTIRELLTRLATRDPRRALQPLVDDAVAATRPLSTAPSPTAPSASRPSMPLVKARAAASNGATLGTQLPSGITGAAAAPIALQPRAKRVRTTLPFPTVAAELAPRVSVRPSLSAPAARRSGSALAARRSERATVAQRSERALAIHRSESAAPASARETGKRAFQPFAFETALFEASAPTRAPHETQTDPPATDAMPDVAQPAVLAARRSKTAAAAANRAQDSAPREATLRTTVQRDETPVTWSVENGNVVTARNRLTAWTTLWTGHARTLASRLSARVRATLAGAHSTAAALAPNATLPPAAWQERTRKRHVVLGGIGISLACALAFVLARPQSPGAAAEQPPEPAGVLSLAGVPIGTTKPAPKAEPEATALDRAPMKEDNLTRQLRSVPPVARPTRAQVARANRAVKRGDGLFKRGKLVPASKAYLYALGNAPADADAMAGLARVHLRRKAGGEALMWAERAVAEKGKDAGYLLLLGDAWAQQAQPVEARAAWTRAAAYGNRTALQRLRSSLEADESSASE